MIEAYSNIRSLANAAAQAIAARLREGLGVRPRAALVATGGRLAGPVYDRLRAAPLEWDRVVVTLSDERCVPADGPDSNARLVRQRLLVGEAAKAHLLPLWPKPEAAALAALTPFDALMLGMGDDGHIASLIPKDPALAKHLDAENPALLADVPAGLGSPPIARITLTLSAVLQARSIFLLIAGELKREVVERALAGADLPVRAIVDQAKAPVRIFWSPSHER